MLIVVMKWSTNVLTSDFVAMNLYEDETQPGIDSGGSKC